MRRSSTEPGRKPWPLVAWALVAARRAGDRDRLRHRVLRRHVDGRRPRPRCRDAGAGDPVRPGPTLLCRGDHDDPADDRVRRAVGGDRPRHRRLRRARPIRRRARPGSRIPATPRSTCNVFSTNQPDLVNGAGGQTPWTQVSIQWTLAPCPGGVFSDETAASPTFATPMQQVVMAMTSGQLAVSLTGMAPGTTYCVGVTQAAPDANNPAATYLSRPYATDSDANAANPALDERHPDQPAVHRADPARRLTRRRNWAAWSRPRASRPHMPGYGIVAGRRGPRPAAVVVGRGATRPARASTGWRRSVRGRRTSHPSGACGGRRASGSAAAPAAERPATSRVNPACTVATADPHEPVVVEGRADAVGDPARGGGVRGLGRREVRHVLRRRVLRRQRVLPGRDR